MLTSLSTADVMYASELRGFGVGGDVNVPVNLLTSHVMYA